MTTPVDNRHHRRTSPATDESQIVNRHHHRRSDNARRHLDTSTHVTCDRRIANRQSSTTTVAATTPDNRQSTPRRTSPATDESQIVNRHHQLFRQQRLKATSEPRSLRQKQAQHFRRTHENLRQRFASEDATDFNLARSRKFTRRSPTRSATFDEADAFGAAHTTMLSAQLKKGVTRCEADSEIAHARTLKIFLQKGWIRIG